MASALAASATSFSAASADIYHVNPYAGHPELSATEAAALWELAKLDQRLRDLLADTHDFAQAPSERAAREQLRAIDAKLALVLTLFKASVWGVVNEMSDPLDAEASYAGDDGADTTVRR